MGGVTHTQLATVLAGYQRRRSVRCAGGCLVLWRIGSVREPGSRTPRRTGHSLEMTSLRTRWWSGPAASPYTPPRSGCGHGLPRWATAAAAGTPRSGFTYSPTAGCSARGLGSLRAQTGCFPNTSTWPSGTIVCDGPNYASYFRVQHVDPPHALVYRSIRHPRRGRPIDIADPESPSKIEQQLRDSGIYLDFTWALVLGELPPDRTRLLVRTRANYSPPAFRLLSLPLGLVEPTYGVAMLRAIARRAETVVSCRPSSPDLGNTPILMRSHNPAQGVGRLAAQRRGCTVGGHAAERGDSSWVM